MSQQLDMFTEAARPTRKRVNVPRTSVLAYQERDRSGRVDFVVQAVQMFETPQTSAELWDACVQPKGPDMDIYWIRRGLSDAQKLGLVEHAPSRECQVSGRQCVTWRLRAR